MAISISYSPAAGGSVSIPLGKILNIRIVRKYHDPLSELYVKCILDTPPTSVPVAMTLTIDSASESFPVKSYIYENRVMTLAGQGLAHRIVDAGVLPDEKYAFTGANLTSQYISPYYPYGSEFPSAPALSIFGWYGNISAWNVIDAYCRQRFERVPRINAQNQVSVYTLNNTAHIALGNQTIGTKAISVKEQTFSVADDSKGVIRKIYVDQSDDPAGPDFSYSETNPYNIGNNVQKVLYWTPPDAYVLIRNAAARTMIYQSTLAKTQVKLKYPVFYGARTGDVVKFSDSRYESGSLKYMYIGEYEAEFENGQWSTSFQLWDTKYLLPWASAELSGKGIPTS